MTKIYEMDDTQLSEYGLSWVPLTKHLPHLPEEDLWVLAWCNGRYVVNGTTLSELEYAIEIGVPRDEITEFLQGWARDLDGGP